MRDVTHPTYKVLHYTVEYLSCVATTHEYSSPFVFNFFRTPSFEHSLGASISWNTRNLSSARTVDRFRLRTDMARSIVFERAPNMSLCSFSPKKFSSISTWNSEFV